MLHCIRFKISLESEFKGKIWQSRKTLGGSCLKVLRCNKLKDKTRLFALAKRDGLGFSFCYF
ncbi:hypothetical protein EUU00_05325 [Campylobacter upsaliensis]|nr:hypothetical protein [Campylobacter upsaliensis]